ncbi:BcsE family c-di-GMP-binding protein, partial [Klebsiella pneumoniae]|uniref:BcsE family c-di-GMP-binding protein n=1 Tax=Klebsiella pneumoniae TaxID=573 RepID=UPI00273171A9
MGISSLWDEVSHMPDRPEWWLNDDRYADDVILFNQKLAAQAKNSNVDELVIRNKPNDIITLDQTHGTENKALFTHTNLHQP